METRPTNNPTGKIQNIVKALRHDKLILVVNDTPTDWHLPNPKVYYPISEDVHAVS
jgi:hypothetical protein